jgi:hypothetical protein
MATIMPEGEKVKQALRWISQEREADSGGTLAGLISYASMKFNLSPKEEEFIHSFYSEKEAVRGFIEK